MNPTSPAPEATFPGFDRDALQFFRDIAANQNKAWYDANKARYEAQVRDPVRALVADLSIALEGRGLPFRCDPMRAMFRLNRDVRFGRDKSPYKTHAGVALTRSGDKMSPGVLYFHLDPLGSFAAAGFYQPEPDALQAMRTRIVERPAEYRDVVAALAGADLLIEPDEQALKRLPRGFESAPAELADALRRRNFVVRHPLTVKTLCSANLTSALAAFAESAAPLLRFGWEALTRLPPQPTRPRRERR